MDFSGSYTVLAPQGRVWDALLDPDVLQQAVPGCERLVREDDETYRLRMNVGVAAVKGVYDGTLRISDRQPTERYRLTLDGKGLRGVLHGNGIVALEARDPQSTVISYSGQVQIGGTLASVGARLASGAANMLIRAFFGRLATLITEGAPATVGVATSATSATSAAADGSPIPASAAIVPEDVEDSPLASPPPWPAVPDDQPAANALSAPTPSSPLDATPPTAPAAEPAEMPAAVATSPSTASEPPAAPSPMVAAAPPVSPASPIGATSAPVGRAPMRGMGIVFLAMVVVVVIVGLAILLRH